MQLAGSCGRCPWPLSRLWCSRPKGGHTPAGFACSHGQADAQPSTRSRGKRSRGSRMLTGDRRFGDPPTQLSWRLSAKQSCSPQSGQTGCEGSGKRTARTLDQTVHANSREHRDSDWLAKPYVCPLRSSNRELSDKKITYLGYESGHRPALPLADRLPSIIREVATRHVQSAN